MVEKGTPVDGDVATTILFAFFDGSIVTENQNSCLAFYFGIRWAILSLIIHANVRNWQKLPLSFCL
jgi:hypothetical protein